KDRADYQPSYLNDPGRVQSRKLWPRKRNEQDRRRCPTPDFRSSLSGSPDSKRYYSKPWFFNREACVMSSRRRSCFRVSKAFDLSKRRRLPRVELLETRQLLTTFLVSNTNDHGSGSLRYAINQANVDPIANGADVIKPSTPLG